MLETQLTPFVSMGKRKEEGGFWVGRMVSVNENKSIRAPKKG